MKPTVGDMVHFYPEIATRKPDERPEPLAAIVTCVHADNPELVDLGVFHPRGYYAHEKVVGANGTGFVVGGSLPVWTWPSE